MLVDGVDKGWLMVSMSAGREISHCPSTYCLVSGNVFVSRQVVFRGEDGDMYTVRYALSTAVCGVQILLFATKHT